MIFGVHVVLARALYIFTELRVRPSKISLSHIHQISQTTDDALIASMKLRIWLRVALFLGEPHTRLHRGESLDTIPVIESAQNLFGETFLR
jgi:hypothetical protein